MRVSPKLYTVALGMGLTMILALMILGIEDTTAQVPAAVPQPSIDGTMLTFRSHQIAAGSRAFNLEGAACPADHTMLSGSCHPGYHDQVIIINQFPNTALNTWRCGFENNTSSTRTVWIYTLCGESGPDTVAHRLQVRRYTTTNLANAEADAILADASNILQTNDGSGDVACAVTLQRDGNVTAFTTGDGSIDSSAEFSTLIGLPGHIKAVNQINWCGGLIPNVIGCAPVPGNSLAVVRFTASLEGILWAHEFGHNKGLGHRNDPNAVMNGTIASTRRRVNQTECDGFSTLPAVAPAPEALVMAQSSGAAQMDIQDFVRQIFIHGVPYKEASQYDSSVVPTLLQMLNDPEEKAFWSNIVVVLGIIGDERAVEPLISFIEAKTDGELSREHYIAKTSALMSLGYLINKSGNQQALDYLKKSVNPQTWEGSQVGIAPFQADTTERNFDFSKHALLGLAVSGHPEAAEVLRSMQQPATTESGRAFRTHIGDLVSEALKEHEQIAEKGLESYYGERQP